jgi:ribosome-associated protein
MQIDELKPLVHKALEDLKAEDILELDVKDKTSVTDIIIVCSGNSNRHVKSIASNVVADCKHAGVQPLGVEGEEQGEWVLVDLGDIIVHVMQPQVRDFYDLESLWQMDLPRSEAASLE